MSGGPLRTIGEIQLPIMVDAELANLTYRNGVLVVALLIAGTSRGAILRMKTVAPAYGERIASHGTPVEPVEGGQHHRLRETAKRPDDV